MADYRLAVTRAALRAQRAVDLSLLALLLAAAVGFAWATLATLSEWRAAERRYAQAVLLWRFGEPAVERLRRCMELAVAHTAPEGRIALLVPGENLLVQRWAAYYLATREVAGGRESLPYADAAVTFGRVEPPGGGATPLAGGPLCRVYRLERMRDNPHPGGDSFTPPPLTPQPLSPPEWGERGPEPRAFIPRGRRHGDGVLGEERTPQRRAGSTGVTAGKRSP